MKNFFKDHHQLTTLTSVASILVLMSAIGLYYLQYDNNGVNWIYAFAYLILTLSACVTFTHNIVVKDKERFGLSFGSLLFCVFSFVSVILKLSAPKLSLDSAFSIFAMSVFMPFALCVIAESAFNISIFEKLWTKIIIAVICIAPVAAYFFATSNTTLYLLKADMIIFGLILLCGIVFSAVNIIKEKETSLNWSYIFFALPYASVYVQKAFNMSKFVKTSQGIALIAISLILVALTFEKHTALQPQGKKHHK